MKRIYCGGTFDLTHYGHFEFFRQARELGDYLIVSLNTDEFAESYKRRPILSLDERIQSVAACRWVDEVIVNIGDEDSTISILNSQANVIVHGDDWTGESLMTQMNLSQDFLDEYGIELAYVPYTEGVSTSDLLERIAERG